MVADVTVTRLADDRVPGRDRRRLPRRRRWPGCGRHVADDERRLDPRRQRRARDDRALGPAAHGTCWPPRRRTTTSATRPSRSAAAASIHVGPAPVLAARISYAGELGWELTTDAEWAVTVWDRLRAAGAAHGLEPFGYRALDALRMEKGYRYYGTDLTMLDTPVRGRSRGVRPARQGAVHRARGARRGARGRPDGPSRASGPSHRRSRLLPIYGGEAVRLDGEVVGRLRSVAYGYDRRAHHRLRLPAAGRR